MNNTMPEEYEVCEGLKLSPRAIRNLSRLKKQHLKRCKGVKAGLAAKNSH